MEKTLTTDSIELFQKSLSAKGRAANTVKARGADLREYFTFAGVHTTDEFSEKAADFLTSVRNDKAARTVRRYMGTLRTFGRWAGVANPLEDYLAPTPAKAQPHPLMEGIEGVLTMLNLADIQDHKNLVALTGLAGLRVQEAVTVTCADVSITERTLSVRGKGDRERVVPLSNRVLRVLAVTLANPDPNDPRLVRLHERTARKVITRLGERAGLARPTASHDMRATFATEAYAKTKNLRAVQELLGHADSRTTEVYTGISMEAMRDAADIGGDEEVVA